MKLDRKPALIVGLVLALIALSASMADAQQIVVAEGDTLVVKIVTGTDTVEVEVPVPGPERCPDGWTCTPPVSSVYTLHITPSGSGVGEVSEGGTIKAGNYSIHLERRDGAWVGGANVGVDSILFTYDGRKNRERFRPYEVAPVPTNISAGTHTVTWEVFGAEPDSGSVTFMATEGLGFRIPEPVPMEDGLMVQVTFLLDDMRPVSDFTATLNGEGGAILPGDLGWYWLPAPPTGEIVVTGPDQTWSKGYD